MKKEERKRRKKKRIREKKIDYILTIGILHNIYTTYTKFYSKSSVYI